MRRTTILVSTLIGLTILASPTPVAAADEVNIDHVEYESGRVSLLLGVDQVPAGQQVDLNAITVTVNGREVKSVVEPVDGNAVDRTTVVVLDASKSMSGEKIAAARSAIESFMSEAPPEVNIGLVTFAGKVKDSLDPTTDHKIVTDALGAVDLDPGTKLYDAIAAAAGVAGDEGARSLLVLSDGADTGSSRTADDLRGLAGDSGIVIDVVALAQSSEQQATLEGIASSTGGQVIPADTAALQSVFSAQGLALASQVVVSFVPPQGTSGEVSVEVTVSAGGEPYSDAAFVPLNLASGDDLVSVDRQAPLVGTTGLIAGAAALALGLASLLGVALVGARSSSLGDRRLDQYFGGVPSGKRQETRSSANSVRESAVDLTSRIVRGDFEDRLATRLAGAGSTLKPAEWLLLHTGVALSFGLVGLLLRGGALMIVLLIVGVVLPWVYLKMRHSRRLAAFNAQLAETLTLMSGGLSAGLSLTQAVDTVVREGHEPMAGELRRALIEQRLGVTMEDALDSVGRRMESDDFVWVVMAIRIQREVGGNLAELLTTVSNTIREREYLRRQVKVLSAESRVSSYVLGGLPVGVFLYMLFMRPDFVRPLYTEPVGIAMSVAALTLLLLGFFMLSRLAKIEV